MKWNPALSHWDGSIGVSSSPSPLAVSDGNDSSQRQTPLESTAYTVCVANTDERRELAASLVANSYGARGYDTSFLDESGASQDTLLTLLFSINDKPEGTFSVRLDTPHGLLADQSYQEELSALRADGRTVIELCRFANDPLLPPRLAGNLMSVQLHLLLMLSKQFRAKNASLVIEVNPHHVRIWRGLGWARSTGARWCERVRAASVLMWIDCAEFVKRGTANLEHTPESSTWKRVAPFSRHELHAMTAQLYHGVANGDFVQ